MRWSRNKEYKTEEDFLKYYNPRDFDLIYITSDILILSISDSLTNNYRKLTNKHFSVWLVKRDNYPLKGKWCLPGGFVRLDEDLEDAPKRILKTETNLSDIYLEQLYTYGSVDRNPRMRVVST